MIIQMFEDEDVQKACLQSLEEILVDNYLQQTSHLSSEQGKHEPLYRKSISFDFIKVYNHKILVKFDLR